ncbi:MAG TPA: hypothetical protein VNC12_10250 [Solirubrobacteraceae bacterium]|nr:hypothetical protein [Solirubrobacteraceae bacterium]
MRRAQALLLPFALFGLLTLTPPAFAAASVPTESYATLLHQLAAKKGDPQSVIAATVDKRKHHIRVTLANNTRPLVSYPPAQDKFLIDTLLRHHIKPKYTDTKKAVHHVLRYIAAGVVAVLLLIGAGVWLYTRGRPQGPSPADGQSQ